MLQERIEVQPREGLGKGAARALRRQGLIPGVVYGHNFGPIPVQVELEELKRLLHHESIESMLIRMKLNGREETVMIKEIQRHPVTYDILHVDFHRVSLTEEVTTRVPVELVGESIGVKEGGILEFLLRELEIRCLPTEIPEHIAIDISQMRIGDSLRVGDLKLKEGITVLDDPDTVIVLIAAPVVREEIEEVEEAAEEAEEEEPELVGEKKEEEEES
ncbi:50S ribosomal protein L25/general stress protein Ctc [Candidatus Poribacteria bacterium]|nr:50S ribosomal protein L25/general stress protein Ctc [Candidatus Poribacteria bacterium]